MEQLSGVQFWVAATLPERHWNLENPQKVPDTKVEKVVFHNKLETSSVTHYTRRAPRIGPGRPKCLVSHSVGQLRVYSRGSLNTSQLFFLVTKCILTHGSTPSLSCAEQRKLNEVFMWDSHEVSTFKTFHGLQAVFLSINFIKPFCSFSIHKTQSQRWFSGFYSSKLCSLSSVVSYFTQPFHM